MKQTLLLLTILFTSISISQTNYQTLKSELFKDSSKESYIVNVTEDGSGGFYMLRMFKSGVIASPSGYYLEHYNSDLKIVKEYEYAPEFHAYEKNKTLIGVVSSENQIHIVDIQYNIKEKAFIGIAHSANLNDFSFKQKELFRLDRKEADKYGTLKFEDLFFESMNVLDDNSEIAFIKDDANTAFAVALNIKSKEAKTFKLYSFDNSLNKKLEHTYIRNFKDKNYHFKNIDVADGGNSIYLLGAGHDNSNKRGEFVYEIAHVTKDGEKVANFENPKPFSESLKLLKINNKLICAGFYSEEKARWYSGISYFEIDPVALKLIKVVHTPLEKQISEQKSKIIWWHNKVYKPLVFKNIIVAENNDIIINAEENYITVMNDHYVYHTDDIISARINTEGLPVWISNINKNCNTMGDQAFISYTSAYSNNNVSFFINTAEKVKTNGSGSIEFGDTGQNRSDFTVVSIGKDGNITYKKLLDDNVNQVPFMTANGFILQNKAFFLGRKGGKKQLLKVQI